jgi:hypothetical protein
MNTDGKPKPEDFLGCEAVSFIDFIRENLCVSVANNAFYFLKDLAVRKTSENLFLATDAHG